MLSVMTVKSYFFLLYLHKRSIWYKINTLYSIFLKWKVMAILMFPVGINIRPFDSCMICFFFKMDNNVKQAYKWIILLQIFETVSADILDFKLKNIKWRINNFNQCRWNVFAINNFVVITVKQPCKNNFENVNCLRNI